MVEMTKRDIQIFLFWLLYVNKMKQEHAQISVLEI